MSKVNIELYEMPIKALFRKHKTPPSVYDELVNIVKEFLPCGECKELLPKESFSKSSSFKARGGRYSMCKECCKDLRKNNQAREIAVHD